MKYRNLVENLSIGIYIIQGTKLVYGNKNFEAIIDHPQSDLLVVDNIYNYIHPGDWELVREIMQKCLSGQKVDARYEVRILTKTGTCRYVEVLSSHCIEFDGKPSVAGALVDITERKKTEAELHRTQEKLRGVLNAAADTISIIDKDGVICEILSRTNENSEMATKFSVGKNICDIVDRTLAHKTMQYVHMALKNKTVCTFDCQIEKNKIYEARLAAINPHEAVLMLRDNTTRRLYDSDNFRTIQERCEALFNNSNDAIFVSPPSTSKHASFLEVNDRACSFLGYTRAELLNMSIADINDSSSLKTTCSQLEKLMKMEHVFFEATFRTKSGRQIAVEINAYMVKFWNTFRVITIAKDVSEQKLSERALLESEERFHYLSNNIPLILWMDDKDGNCTFVNEKWREYTGVTTQNPAEITWTDYIHPKDRQMVEDTFCSAVNRKKKYFYEYRMLRFDGRYRWVQSSGIPRFDTDNTFVGYINCCLDIHDKILADRDLKYYYKRLERSAEEQTRQLANTNAILAQEIFVRRAAEKRYRQLFDSVQDAIFVWKITAQGLPGRIIEVNNVACRWLGYSRNELLSLCMFDTMSNQGKAATTLRMEKLLASRQAIFEFDHVTKDGRIILAEVNAHLFALNGELVGLSIARDISDRKKAETELLAARDRINKAEKLAFLGNMAAGIAHEINQPLNSIKVTADSILMWSKEGNTYNWEEFLEDVQTISEQSSRIASIIKYIRDLIRTNQTPNNQRFSLAIAVRNTIKMMTPNLDAVGVTLIHDLTDDPLEIYGSLAYMEHVILNLMNNALQALVSSPQPQKEITIRTKYQDKIILQVSDNGPGIPEAVKAKIFTPFFTTKNDGMGLGLAIVKSVVTSNGGNIMIFDNPDRGVTFQLEFPTMEPNGCKEDVSN